MRKHFLLLFLMALLPLAGWAADPIIDNEYDVNVVPSDASAVWCGGKPTVQAGWVIVQSETAQKPTKAQVAAQIEIRDLANYNVSDHTYALQLKANADGYVDIATGVEDHYNRYYLHTNAQNTATLTITKFTGDPVIEPNQLAYVENFAYTGSAKSLLTLTDADGAKAATATVNGVAAPVVYALSADAETWVEDYTAITGTDAGTYTVYYKVAGTTNYTGSATATAFGGGMKILQKDLTDDFTVAGAKPTANTWTYDTEAHALFTAPTAPVAFGTYEYSLTGADETWYTSAQIAASEDLTAAFKGTSNTGNKTVYWRVKETANYTGYDATPLTATIDKATPEFTVLPTFAESKTYDGQEVNLITSAGTATLGATPTFETRVAKANGVQYWAWSGMTADTNADNFKKTNATKVQIRYSTQETADLEAVTVSEPTTIIISKATIAAESFTLPTAIEGLVYDGSAKALVEEATWKDPTDHPAATFKYSLDNTNWYDAVDADDVKGTDAGNYSVYFKVVPTDATNYAEYVLAEPIAAAIDKATIPAESFNAPVAATGLKADGNAHALVTAATWIDPNNYGTFKYSLDNTNWYDAVDADDVKGTAAGNYSVYFKIEPTDATNYGEYVAAEPIAVTIGGYTPVYIVPTAAQKYYGTEDPASFEYTVEDATTGDVLANDVLKGTVSLARTTGNAIGTYKIYVKKYTPAAEDGDYTVVNILNTPASEDAANKTAAFTILVDPNAELKLNFTADAIANKASKVYDGTTDITALGFTVDDLEADETTLIGEDTWASLKGSANVVFALAAENGNAQETQVTATVSGGLTARYATVTVTPMDFEITKLPITITANDQVIAQGADIDQDEYVTAPAPVAGDDLNIVLTATKSAVGEWDDAITVAATNANYDFNFVPGKLTINGAADIALGAGGNDFQTISDYAGQNVNVTIDFTARNDRELPVGTAREWKANTWNTLVLPFDISVAELSQKLGYAIVNVIDKSRTEISGTSSKFYGKLTMKGGNGDGTEDYLVANKPFMVKTADAITGIIDFGNQTIVAPASAADLSVDAGGGAKFTGTYEAKPVTGDDNAKIWFMVGNSDQWLYIGAGKSHVWNILPFEGFIDMNGSSARNMTFYFEEIDGSTTAIRNVDVDDLNGKIAAEGMYNMNGMKLNTVPTQKGVYILNGKKVVIK